MLPSCRAMDSALQCFITKVLLLEQLLVLHLCQHPDMTTISCEWQHHSLTKPACMLQDIFTSLTGASKPHHVVDEKGVVLGYSHFGMLAAARYVASDSACKRMSF